MRKNEVLIEFLRTMIKDYLIVGEFKTSYAREKQITVQEHGGDKIVLNEANPLFNYFQIVIFGDSIQEMKYLSEDIGCLIGKTKKIKIGKCYYQLIFKQFSNPEQMEYQDIKRVGYSMVLKCIINKFMEEK